MQHLFIVLSASSAGFKSSHFHKNKHDHDETVEGEVYVTYHDHQEHGQLNCVVFVLFTDGNLWILFLPKNDVAVDLPGYVDAFTNEP